MKNTFGLLVAVFLLGSCQEKEPISILIDKNTVVLLDTPDNKAMNSQGFATWKPNISDYNIIDDVFQKAIRDGKFNFLKEPVSEALKNGYKKQYLPFINKSNQKIIKISAFCLSKKNSDSLDYTENDMMEYYDWTQMFFAVDDGGPCYWNMKINVDTGEYFDLMVNNY